ncbi:Serine/threonine-protein kinase env7 [Entomophthora muscae]|uniref:Serine/threonine-protein kinase env7 n=1 Tax=Entomophthora muscae TaxID=34485 RepID=A0ACC2SN20_9FUNG|nr:Serine/threonine-protein kinase env7 [Entomophthora muscae]
MDFLSRVLSDSLVTVFGSCLPSGLIITVNNKSFRVLKLLGEGGFSTVYLVRDVSTSKVFAVKKIFCSKNDPEAFQIAFREAEINRLFSHPNITTVIDICTENQDDGSRIVYIFFKYYERGSLHDAIEANVISKKYFSEKEALELFYGVCQAVKELHRYKLTDVPSMGSQEPEHNLSEDATIEEDESASHLNYIPYAHRDIKPGNVMLSDDGKPILMDFGSAERARCSIKTRQQALAEQEKAAKFSTMIYRAPELFDVEVGREITESVDIWSLGCLLYAIAYGSSPFESSVTEHGGSTALAVMNGKYTFPRNDPYSQKFRDLIELMLVTDPASRPTIEQVIESTQQLLSQ